MKTFSMKPLSNGTITFISVQNYYAILFLYKMFRFNIFYYLNAHETVPVT